MKIGCPCGVTIADQTDALPNKAHLLPDQDWFTVFDKLDDLIADAASGAKAIDQAQTEMRSALVKFTRQAWQCPACGLLHVEDHHHNLNPYTPGDTSSRTILRGKNLA